MAEFSVRAAREEDCEEILRLIKELAEFEKMADQVNMNAETLKRDGFGKEKLYHSIVAEPTSPTTASSTNGRPLIGYLVYFWAYSTWEGRTLYIEDICVTEKYRRYGVGSALWREAVKVALDLGVRRTQWAVLDWNVPAISMYKKMGAVNLSEREGWLTYRMNHDTMQQLVSKPN